MKGLRRWFCIVSWAVVLATFATCLPAQVPPEKTEIAQLLALGGDRFSIHRTDHFLIASDGDAGLVNPLADRLEATYQAVVRFTDDLKLPIHPPPDPLPVLLFNRHSDFQRHAGAVGHQDSAAPGFYNPRNNTVAFCNVLDLPQLREISLRIKQAEVQQDPSVAPERIAEWKSQHDAIVETFNRMVIQHEAAHQVLFNTGVLSPNADNPDWLVEGLACLFEVPSPDAVNQLRLADFRDALAAPNAASVAASAQSAAKTDRRLLALTDLIADDLFNVADESTRTIRYAQAWALVEYLRRTRSDEFAAYVRIIAARPPNEPPDRQRRITVFQSVFGSPDQELERLWIEYVLRLPIDPRQTER